jgi:hypothetical protein
MFFVAFGLLAGSGLFYFASNRNAPSWTRPLCTYGDTFCQNPQWLLYAAAIALVWALFLRVDRV